MTDMSHKFQIPLACPFLYQLSLNSYLIGKVTVLAYNLKTEFHCCARLASGIVRVFNPTISVKKWFYFSFQFTTVDKNVLSIQILDYQNSFAYYFTSRFQSKLVAKHHRCEILWTLLLLWSYSQFLMSSLNI